MKGVSHGREWLAGLPSGIVGVWTGRGPAESLLHPALGGLQSYTSPADLAVDFTRGDIDDPSRR